MAIAQPAEAATLLYSLQGDSADKWTAEFELDTSAPRSPVLSGSFRINGVSIDFTRPNSNVVEKADFSNTGITFRTLQNQGGIFLGRLPTINGLGGSFQIFGPQLFSGPTNNPEFLTGTFRLSDVSRQRTTDPLLENYTLTVTDTSVLAAVPEPATWAMLFLGLGFIGGAMRSARRKANVSVSYA
jgi:hypothetical protein